MFWRSLAVVIGVSAFVIALARATLPPGDPKQGAQAFRQCVACHSVEPGVHLTGPSLARIWGRKAGTVGGFTRYSDVLRKANVVWNEETLDAWLKDSQRFIPNNLMTVPGIIDEKERTHLIAYLKAISTGESPPGMPRSAGMAGPGTELKEISQNRQVKTIRYCGDTYHVTTISGETFPFWEFNLRFKTDSSKNGPSRGRPVLIPAGMMGDRAFVIFSSPEEISAMIERKC